MEYDVIKNPFSYVPPIFKQQAQQQSLLQQNGDQSLSNVSSLAVGYGNTALYVDQLGLRLGNQHFASAPFSVDMNGNITASTLVVGNSQIANGAVTGTKIAANTITASNISAGTITATQISASAGITAGMLSVSQLSAITANLGTITAGTINGVTIQLPNESLATGNAGKLIWASNARIWGDSSGNIGINGAGAGSAGVYLYGSSNTVATFLNASQSSVYGGLYVHSGNGQPGNFNVDGSSAINALRLSNNAVENNITDVNIIKGYNDVNLQLGDNTFHISFYNVGFTEVAYVDSSGNIHKNGTVSFDITHPTKEGYRLKYPSVEAPEVALQIRGIAKLVDGVAKIGTPDHWSLVTEENGLNTVVLTPLGKTKGLFVPKDTLTTTEFEVHAIDENEKDTEFMWQLTSVRKGYLDFMPEYPNDTARKFKLAQEAHWKGKELNDEQKELLKDILPKKKIIKNELLQ